MKNLYFYIFYLLVKFVNKINKNDITPAFSGILLISLPLLFSLLSIFFILGGSTITKSNASLLGIGMSLVVLIINYFILYKKSDQIITYYDRNGKSGNQNIIIIGCFLVYLIASAAMCYYFAYLVRNGKL